MTSIFVGEITIESPLNLINSPFFLVKSRGNHQLSSPELTMTHEHHDVVVGVVAEESCVVLFSRGYHLQLHRLGRRRDVTGESR